MPKNVLKKKQKQSQHCIHNKTRIFFEEEEVCVDCCLVSQSLKQRSCSTCWSSEYIIRMTQLPPH